MITDKDLSDYWCCNKECSDYGRRNMGNLSIHDRIGHDKHLLLKCKTCGRTFSETRGTMFFGLRTPHQEILHTLALLPEKGSIRAVARVTSHDKNTICKWFDLAEAHARQTTEYFLRYLGLSQVEVDEIWFYKKR